MIQLSQTLSLLSPKWVSQVALMVRKLSADAGDLRDKSSIHGNPLQYSWASLVAQLVKNLPSMQDTWVQTLGWEDSLEKQMATNSSILAWRIPMDRGAWWATVQRVTKSWIK